MQRTTPAGFVLGILLIAGGCGGLVPATPPPPTLPEASPAAELPDSATAPLDEALAVAVVDTTPRAVWGPDSTGVSLQLLMDTDGDGGFDLIWKGNPTYRWDRPSMGKFEVTQRDTSGTWIRTTEGPIAYDITPPDWVMTPPDSSVVNIDQFGRFGRSYGKVALTWPAEGYVETVEVDSLGLSIWIPGPVFNSHGSLHIKWDVAGRVEYLLLERPENGGQ